MESIEIKTKDNVTICTPKNMETKTPYVLFEQFDWCENEIQFCRDYLKKGMTFIDVGAGFGVYALLAAKQVGEEGKVIAIEPNLLSRKFLELSKQQNEFKHIEIINQAIGETAEKRAWYSATVPEKSSFSEESNEEVEAIQFDSLWESVGSISVDFVKVDVNGFELEVLKGASKLLSDQDCIIQVAVNEETIESINNFFEAINYKVLEYVPGTGVLAKFEAESSFNPYLANIIACSSSMYKELKSDGWILDEKVELDVPDADVWETYFNSIPWAQNLLFEWVYQSDMEVNAPYFEALNRIIAAEKIEVQNFEDRQKKTMHLVKAVQLLVELYNTRNTNASISFTLARVLNLLGKRDQAVQVLKNLIDHTAFGQRNMDTSLPFLLPVEYQNHPQIRTDFSKWLMVRTIESWILLKDTTTFDVEANQLQLIEILEGNPEISPKIANIHKVMKIRDKWSDPENKPKSLLFITTDFPPYDEGRVGHSIRAYTLANFFAENGYKVYLLILAKMIADRDPPYMHENIQIINPVFHEQKATKEDLNAEEFCVNFITQNKIPTLLTSSPPLTASLIGYTVKKELGDLLYWISDFRDFIHVHPMTRANTEVGLLEQKTAESDVMQTSDAVITVSTGMTKIAEELNIELDQPFEEAKYEIIENGFIEQEEIAPQADVVEFVNRERQEGKIILYYAGTGSLIGIQKFEGVYKDLTFIFDVFAQNPEIAKKYALVIQGKIQVNLDYLKRLKTKLSYKFFDPVPNAQIQANMKLGDIGLSVNSDEIATPYIMGGKLYDYANAELALLLIYPDNPFSLREFSERHGNKCYFANVFDPNSVKEILSQILVERNSLDSKKFTKDEIKPYSRNAQYQKFLNLIEESVSKKKPRFIHFCYNSIYAQSLSDMLKYTNSMTSHEHILYVEREQTIKQFNVDLKDNDNAFLFDRNRDGKALLSEIMDDSVQAIFMHGLFRPWQYDIVKNVGEHKHIGWSIWGGDLYNPIRNNQTHLFPASKISSIISSAKGDIELFEQHFGSKQHFDFGYVYPGLYDDVELTNSVKRTKRIVVGNSGDPSNNHLEIIKVLAEKNDIKEYTIVFPVAYNFSDEYRQTLMRELTNLGLSENVEFHEEFIPPKEYMNLVSNSDLMITAHNRQQAMGNLLMAIYQNKPVFIRKYIIQDGIEIINPGWNYLKELGLEVNAFEDLNLISDISEIKIQSEEQHQLNIDSINKNLGLAKRAKELQNACEVIIQSEKAKKETAFV